jgi:hypothetical protein
MFADLGRLDHGLASISVQRGNKAQAAEVAAMAEPINFNKAKKARDAAEARAQARANRVKFGRTKGEKEAARLAAERARRALDQTKRED